ncbi:glutathione S-transferase [Rhodoplanes elegans]|uniref:Glutathione S-transferase n=1 Tax=Rhodoplanes elegans TaxID=29408 RepID=A0A327KFT8_9BRAD|nr:glutathione S-transferase family protein [Rhodoplanes elegans]MBK5959141.1 glutathione S-transferase [Rhodoplanes elegans]RAI36991.1 glutathione S-transferase [Rhodoplanes elegans]
MALILYHIAPSRSSIVRWMLEEIGQPYALRVLSMSKGENRDPAYLAVNPMGKVPALDHDGVVITEVSAICCYLADAFPQAGLAPPIGDKRRGPYLKWLFFGPSCIEPAIIDRTFKRAQEAPRGTLGYGDFDTVMDVVSGALTAGPYLLGDTFTAADIVIGSQLRWGMMFGLIPPRPEFVSYVERLNARPALQKATALDAELKDKAG